MRSTSRRHPSRYSAPESTAARSASRTTCAARRRRSGAPRAARARPRTVCGATASTRVAALPAHVGRIVGRLRRRVHGVRTVRGSRAHRRSARARAVRHRRGPRRRGCPPARSARSPITRSSACRPFAATPAAWLFRFAMKSALSRRAIVAAVDEQRTSSEGGARSSSNVATVKVTPRITMPCNSAARNNVEPRRSLIAGRAELRVG